VQTGGQAENAEVSKNMVLNPNKILEINSFAN
jgi:hypothetical protein